MPDLVVSHEGEWPKTLVLCSGCGLIEGEVSRMPSCCRACGSQAPPVGVEVVPVQRGAEDTEAIRLRDAFAYLRESIMENPGGEFEHLGDVATYCREVLDAARLDTTKETHDG